MIFSTTVSQKRKFAESKITDNNNVDHFDGTFVNLQQICLTFY